MYPSSNGYSKLQLWRRLVIQARATRGNRDMDMPRLEGACEPAEHCQEADTQDDVQEVVGTHFCVGGASKAKVLIPELLLLLLHDVNGRLFNCR